MIQPPRCCPRNASAIRRNHGNPRNFAGKQLAAVVVLPEGTMTNLKTLITPTALLAAFTLAAAPTFAQERTRARASAGERHSRRQPRQPRARIAAQPQARGAAAQAALRQPQGNPSAGAAPSGSPARPAAAGRPGSASAQPPPRSRRRRARTTTRRMSRTQPNGPARAVRRDDVYRAARQRCRRA